MTKSSQQRSLDTIVREREEGLLTAGAIVDWLEEDREDFAPALATRSALRALPIALNHQVDPERCLDLFRATFFCWAMQNLQPEGFSRALERVKFVVKPETVDLDNEPATAIYHSQIANWLNGTLDGSKQLRNEMLWRTSEAIFTASTSIARENIGPVSQLSFEQFWNVTGNDCQWLERQPDTLRAIRKLSHRKLWPAHRPSRGVSQAWGMVQSKLLLGAGSDFESWIDWYERRERGERAAFDIPGDRGRREDKTILRKLAGATNEDFWDRGFEHVNAELTRWLYEARDRASARARNENELHDDAAKILDELMPDEPSDRTAIVANLQSAASPQATESDGKLDAGPNSTFDQPTYSGDLADLPSELRSFVRVLSNSLGENASAFMRASLAEYENEVLVRGNRPIVGTLKGLVSAIGREVWSAESLAASDDPDDWQMRDEREWGPGMGDLFRTFFRYHQDLITHFPLDEEREEILRSLPIDELAASGDALVDPVELVTGLIRDLHGQGMATDDILKIVEAHEQYNANIASLPPVSADLPADYVTPKRRHVLMTAGFYLHLYSVLGSTASLGSILAANPALTTQIHLAAEALMKFII